MAIPCLDTMIENINSRFSGEVVELVVSASVFNPALLPNDETLLRAYANSKPSTLANFYEEKVEVTFEGVTYASLAIINKEELLGEWQVFKRAVFQEKKVMMEKNTSPPSLQDIKDTMETNYACIFPETFKMVFLVLPIGTAQVGRSFSHLEMIKTRLLLPRLKIRHVLAITLVRTS